MYDVVKKQEKQNEKFNWEREKNMQQTHSALYKNQQNDRSMVVSGKSIAHLDWNWMKNQQQH